MPLTCGMRLQRLEAGLAALRGGHIETLVLQQDAQGIEDALLVVDDEDRGLGRSSGWRGGHQAASSFRRAAGKITVKVVPRPTVVSTMTRPL